jgi:hypothetical protein
MEKEYHIQETLLIWGNGLVEEMSVVIDLN